MDSKNIVVKALRIKKIAIWSAISCGCIIALVQWARAFMAGTARGEEIFIPGVLALTVVVLLVLTYAITRVIKYVKMFCE